MASTHPLRLTPPRQYPSAVRLVCRALERLRFGKLEVSLPGGEQLAFGGHETGPWARWVVRNENAFRRVLLRGDLGFAEGYIEGEWDTPNLLDLLMLLDLNREQLGEASNGRLVSRFRDLLMHWSRRNSREGSRDNIAAHYDLGNDFYRQWLDETLTYSSAIFETGSQSLKNAQLNKYNRLLECIGPRRGDHLLEIGSGWGGFAVHAARTRGCRVTSITLSSEQLHEARARANAANVADLVEFRLQDYRDIVGRYDAIVSIEMFEAVGENYWPAWFRTVHRALKPGGRVASQVITINDRDFSAYRRRVDFIQRYIFPGGMLPSPGIFETGARRAGLELVERSFFGLHYADTLKQWKQRFFAARSALLGMGHDERFLRTWHYYLAYCETGFRNHRTDVMQVVLQRKE